MCAARPLGLNEVAQYLVWVLGELLKDRFSHGLLRLGARADKPSRGLNHDAGIVVLTETDEHRERLRVRSREPPNRAGGFAADVLRRIAMGETLELGQRAAVLGSCSVHRGALPNPGIRIAQTLVHDPGIAGPAFSAKAAAQHRLRCCADASPLLAEQASDADVAQPWIATEFATRRAGE